MGRNATRMSVTGKRRYCNTSGVGPTNVISPLAWVCATVNLKLQLRPTTTTMTSGTQSPPLEATGEHKCMGISSVNNPDAKIEVVPDSEQRARVFSLFAVTEIGP